MVWQFTKLLLSPLSHGSKLVYRPGASPFGYAGNVVGVKGIEPSGSL